MTTTKKKPRVTVTRKRPVRLQETPFPRVPPLRDMGVSLTQVRDSLAAAHSSLSGLQARLCALEDLSHSRNLRLCALETPRPSWWRRLLFLEPAPKS